MGFDLIIFDCDGVLVDSEPLVNTLFVDLVREDGVNLDVHESLRQFSGASLASRIQRVREQSGWVPRPTFAEVFEERLTHTVQRDLRPVPGIESALREIRGPRCVASNGTRPEIELRLQVTQLLAHFAPHLFSAADCARSKPHPDVFLHAASSMGVLPSRCAIVEDSVPGVQAATAAGMTVFAYAAHRAPSELAQLGAHVFSDMAYLPGLLQ
jgi:phosphoglycolate phosphatase